MLKQTAKHEDTIEAVKDDSLAYCGGGATKE
jgi:hypothetical protein